MNQKKSALVSGVTILSIAGILSKVIGLLFRIPLTYMIGADGLGIYQGVYPTYTLLLTISTAGIPVAVSRLVSESTALGRPREARAVLRTSIPVLAVIGTTLMVLLVLFAGVLAERTGDPGTTAGYRAIAPSILLVSIMSALRGYMQGRNRMTPTAVSQIIEQLGKVLFSLPLSALGMRMGGVVQAATFALLGITAGEACALGYMIIVYARKRPAYLREEQSDPREPSSNAQLIQTLLRIAIPITIGSIIVPIGGFVDSAQVRIRLQVAGFDTEAARVLYGLLSGTVLSIINVPTVLATAVCIGLVPLISAARVENRIGDMHDTSRLGLRLASLLGFPCSMGISLLSTPIVSLLYGSALTPAQTQIAGNILAISAWTIVLFTHVQATTGILQGAGYHKIPMYSLVAGVLCKILLNFVLIAQPSINIFGAPIASLTCYGLSMVVNLLFILRKTGLRFDFGSIVFRPLLATLGMGAAVYGMTLLLSMTRRSHTLVAVVIGVAVYCVLVFAVGALRREDMDQIPGGAKLERLFVRLRIWR